AEQALELWLHRDQPVVELLAGVGGEHATDGELDRARMRERYGHGARDDTRDRDEPRSGSRVARTPHCAAASPGATIQMTVVLLCGSERSATESASLVRESIRT